MQSSCTVSEKSLYAFSYEHMKEASISTCAKIDTKYPQAKNMKKKNLSWPFLNITLRTNQETQSSLFSSGAGHL